MQQATRDLIAWNRKFGHATAVMPTVPEDAVASLRERLIDEEYGELMAALAVNDLPNILKEGLDLIWVVTGTLLAYGLDPAGGWAELVRSNMSKGTEKDEFGKTRKGPDFVAADMVRVLRDQRPIDEAYGGEAG